MSADEMLGMFLNILGHGSANRQAQDRFQHSDVIKLLENAYNNTPKEILQDSRYMPHFKMVFMSKP
ncbi:unnamed protein product [Prunus armeniaca]